MLWNIHIFKMLRGKRKLLQLMDMRISLIVMMVLLYMHMLQSIKWYILSRCRFVYHLQKDILPN